jgi:DNA repair exonuclease SbcCD ATPase subunit
MDEYSGIEQLEKRVEWLDNERRNDKTNLASLQNRLTILEGENLNLRKQIKELEVLINRNSTQIASMDKYDNRIDRLNIELTKQIREVNERAENNLSEAQKRSKLEVDSTKKTIAELYPLMDMFDPIRTDITALKAEDSRLARLNEELKAKIQDVGRFDEDYRRSLHLLEEGRRQEAKRITDLQGEVASVRKRLEETRGRFDSFSDSFRTFDTRIAEIQSNEKDRRENQSQFIDRVNSSLVEKDKVFVSWEKRFAEIDQFNANLGSQIETLEKIRLSVTKAIQTSEEASQRFERRINEITELQRLNDDRYRQEWTNFKSDDVKRWTNYMLAHEEQTRETTQQFSNLTKQLQEMDDLTALMRDDLDNLSREIVRHVQTILVAFQESIQSVAPLLDKKAS